MIRAVLWDIDGTLVDSEPLHLLALKTICAHHGADISDLADDHFVGVNLPGVWAALCPRFPAGLSFAEWSAALNAVYVDQAPSLHFIPQARQTIHALDLLGIRQVAVSNSNRIVVDTNLAALGVQDILEFSLSLDDVAQGKPAPEPYLKALNLMQLRPEYAVAVEDSTTGLRSAKAAGIKVIGLGHAGLQADFHINDLGDVLRCLKAA